MSSCTTLVHLFILNLSKIASCFLHSFRTVVPRMRMQRYVLFSFLQHPAQSFFNIIFSAKLNTLKGNIIILKKIIAT